MSITKAFQCALHAPCSTFWSRIFCWRAQREKRECHAQTHVRFTRWLHFFATTSNNPQIIGFKAEDKQHFSTPCTRPVLHFGADFYVGELSEKNVNAMHRRTCVLHVGCISLPQRQIIRRL